MSLLEKKWIVRNSDDTQSTFEKILFNRGVKNIDEGLVFHDPFLFTDMEKAVARIELAIKNNERIIVFGDYDVDGISGAVLMINVLKRLGANVSYRLPNRVSDGYGMSMKFIDEFIEKEIKLVITVDCGISCVKEISKAKANGIDVIVTDHHAVPEKLPSDAFAILHPKINNVEYPYQELTGSGMALKFAQAILEKNKIADKNLIEELITLASLGTVADLGPLRGENRLIVKKGLEGLINTRCNGLRKLLQLSGMTETNIPDTQTISYRIAPRINAAGRIGDPYIALNLLLQDEFSDKVTFLGDKLESLNVERQEMTEKALRQAESLFIDRENLPSILIAENENWHVGILGLVAAKLAESFGRPVIIMQDFGDTLVASARSPKFFHITDALTQCREYLISFGGHAQAAGFNIKKENLEKFSEMISKIAEEKLKTADLKPILEVDCELKHNEVNFAFISQMKELEPFGVGNEKPTFILSEVEPYFVNTVGRDNTHLKFSVKILDKDVQVIAFNMGHLVDEIRQYKKVDFVCYLDKNTWNNRDYLQLKAIDIRKSE